jgi:hypothetical protein
MEPSGQLQAPAALSLGRRYPLDWRLGRPQSRSGLCGERQYLELPGIEFGPSSQKVVATPKALSIRVYVFLNQTVSS